MGQDLWWKHEMVSVDSRAIQQKMAEMSMSRPEIKKSLKSAIRQSLNIVRSSVRKGAAAVTSNPEKTRKGVGMVIYKNGSGGQVNIYTPFYVSNSKGRGLFILRWLEEGTQEGIDRNGKRHGATPAKPFFNQAVSSSIGRAERAISATILQTIDNVVAKRK